MNDNLILDEFVGIDAPTLKSFDEETDKKLENGKVIKLDDGSIACRIVVTGARENGC